MKLSELKKAGRLIECEQGSDEWLEARRGRVTASKFADAIAGGQGKTRTKYMHQLLAERLTGEVDQNGYTNPYMGRGLEQEKKARINYELETGTEVTEVGFVLLNENIGCSPDGLVGDNGLIQIKCPASHTHIEYLLTSKVPSNYIKQIQGELWVTEREWSDFVSFDSRNKYRDFLRIRVERDDAFIATLKNGIDLFVAELLHHEKILKVAA